MMSLPSYAVTRGTYHQLVQLDMSFEVANLRLGWGGEKPHG